MELLSVHLARVIWFVETRDINPRGIHLPHTFFPELIEKYKFASYPRLEDLVNPNRKPGDEFIGGQFRNAQGLDVTINFTHFNDGLVADMQSSTKDAEDFLIELTDWMVKEFGLVFTQDMIRRWGYVSEVHVRSKNNLSILTPEMKRFADKLTGLISAREEGVTYELSGLMFSPNTELSLKPAGFHFERALDTLFSENRYYSKAPFDTDTHLELINELEQILTA